MKIRFLCATIIALSTAAMAADPVYLVCDAERKYARKQALDGPIHITIEVALKQRVISYDNRDYRIYEMDDAQIRSFAKFEVDGANTVISIDLNRRSGRIDIIGNTTETLSGGVWGLDLTFDDDNTVYDWEFYARGVCRPIDQKF